MIDRDALAMSLNDHLTGSVSTLRMIGLVRDARELATFQDVIQTVTRGVETERGVLQRLLTLIGASESIGAATIARVGAHAARAQLSIERDEELRFLLFEAIEYLMLGLYGRLALWSVLETLEGDLRSGCDFKQLGGTAARHARMLGQIRLCVGRGVSAVA